MSSTTNNETAQQRRKRLLLAQVERQRVREEEIARQEAEFAMEMERLKAEMAREEEEKRLTKERRVFFLDEKQEVLAEKKRTEEIRLAAAKQREEERLAEEAAAEVEEEQTRTAAFAKLVEENKKEKGAGFGEKTFKSKAVISDDSDKEGEDRSKEPALRGVKCKRTIKMIAKVSDNLFGVLLTNSCLLSDNNTSDPDGDSGPIPGQAAKQPPSDSLQPRPACSRCVMIGRPSECQPQSTRQQAQVCVVCHHQCQQCSWSGDNAARQLQGKRVKVDEDEYEGPITRVGERRRFEGAEVAKQLAKITEQNRELVDIARHSLVLQERMLGIMARREKQEIDAIGRK
ncbi:hypothetical protein GGU11DRAFT_749704 [Lentinula aff. detonsa]|nr:hypothetical protein GGU11DRAFT_749704 [Lentinula aff. detonsa]